MHDIVADLAPDMRVNQQLPLMSISSDRSASRGDELAQNGHVATQDMDHSHWRFGNVDRKA